MLPGFRFLFAAIVLSMSILVFGLGAAALLRAAHEQFASNTSLRAAPETSFAQPSEPTKPVLAVLRLEPPAPDPRAAATPADSPATSAPAEPESIVSTSPEPEKTAALSAPESSPSASPPEPARAEALSGVSPMATEVPPTATAEAPVANGVSPAPADTAVTDAAAANEAKVAASGQPSPPANETASEPTSVPAGTNADLIAAKIATLDGPPVTIQNQAPDKAKSAEIKAAEIKGAGIKTLEPDRDEIKKRLRAERARERRRLAARQQARQQAASAQQQQAANPFAQQPPAAAQQQAASRYQPTQAARTP